MAKLLDKDWSDEEVLKFVARVFKGLAILNISERNFYRSGLPIEKNVLLHFSSFDICSPFYITVVENTLWSPGKLLLETNGRNSFED